MDINFDAAAVVASCIAVWNIGMMFKANKMRKRLEAQVHGYMELCGNLQKQKADLDRQRLELETEKQRIMLSGRMESGTMLPGDLIEYLSQRGKEPTRH